jgi:hypothetical protein
MAVRRMILEEVSQELNLTVGSEKKEDGCGCEKRGREDGGESEGLAVQPVVLV